MAITTGNFPKLLWPGLNAIFGTTYDSYEKLWPKLFDQKTSDKAYEEDVQVTGFGLAGVKPQGQPITYETMQQGFTSRYVNITYGLGFIITKEEIDDNLYLGAGEIRTEQLSFVMDTTKEIVLHGIYNNSFSNTGPDGVSLINSAHPVVGGGTQSNTLATAMQLSEAGLESACINIGLLKNDRGIQIHIQPRCLVIPTQLGPDAYRILRSTLQSGTANNDVNYLRAAGLIPDIIVSPFLAVNPHYWYIRTNCPNGMKYFSRAPLEFTQDNDFDTENAKFKAMERYSAGYSDWRALFGVNAT